jgi:hypothetical protein
LVRPCIKGWTIWGVSGSHPIPAGPDYILKYSPESVDTKYNPVCLKRTYYIQ